MITNATELKEVLIARRRDFRGIGVTILEIDRPLGLAEILADILSEELRALAEVRKLRGDLLEADMEIRTLQKQLDEERDETSRLKEQATRLANRISDLEHQI